MATATDYSKYAYKGRILPDERKQFEAFIIKGKAAYKAYHDHLGDGDEDRYEQIFVGLLKWRWVLSNKIFIPNCRLMVNVINYFGNFGPKQKPHVKG